MSQLNKPSHIQFNTKNNYTILVAKKCLSLCHMPRTEHIGREEFFAHVTFGSYEIAEDTYKALYDELLS